MHTSPAARLAPGLGLAAALALAAFGLQQLETRWLGYAVIESLVIAILLGMLWRNLRGLSPQAQPGVSFTAKTVLEWAIVLLGASVDLPALLRAGPLLLLAITITVLAGITASMAIGRLLGLNMRLAILVAVGNAICGNSAIAAVAPVIGADGDDVASAIALTAVLGVAMVLGLPLLIPLLQLSAYQYGVLAGMTVYAVPQVLAATFPVSALSGEVGTLVKLVRVLLLGPVVLVFSLAYAGRPSPKTPVEHPRRPTKTHEKKRPFVGLRGPSWIKNGLLYQHSRRLARFVPWFIAGFVLLAALRSAGLLPQALAGPLRELSRWLTIAAMAALGLGVHLRAVRRVGPAVAAAVLGSLLVLLVLSVALIFGFAIGVG